MTGLFTIRYMTERMNTSWRAYSLRSHSLTALFSYAITWPSILSPCRIRPCYNIAVRRSGGMVDALVSKTSGVTPRAGSTPAFGTSDGGSTFGASGGTHMIRYFFQSQTLRGSNGGVGRFRGGPYG